MTAPSGTANVGPKPGIVWIASYPKSGNTWARTFLHNLAKILAGENDAQDINAMWRFSTWEINKQLYTEVLGFEPTDSHRSDVATVRHQVQQRIADRFDGLVFVKTHNALINDGGYSLVNFAVTSGAIYIVRNPLDVAVSYTHHSGRSLDEIIQVMGTEYAASTVTDKVVHEVQGSWSQNVLSWTHKPHPAIYLMRYEDMLAEPEKTFGDLVRHLLIDASPAQLSEAIERSSFERLRAQEQESGFRERSKTASAQFFREGRAGQWKEILTRNQIDRIVSDHRQQMARFGYLGDGFANATPGQRTSPRQQAAGPSVLQRAATSAPHPSHFHRPQAGEGPAMRDGKPAAAAPEGAPVLTASSQCFADKEFSTDWTSHNFPIWTAILAPFRDRALDVLEIGSWEGRSAIFWLEYLPLAQLVCIDSFDGGVAGPTLPEWRAQVPFTQARFDANLSPYAGRFEKIVARSVVALNRLRANGSSFDLIYIDGEHMRDEVLVDSLLAWPLLKPGGILIWDDYEWNLHPPSEGRPKDAIDAFLHLHPGHYIERHRGYQVIIEKCGPGAAACGVERDPSATLGQRISPRRQAAGPSVLQRAATLYHQHRLDEAELLCREILSSMGAHYDALNLLGAIRLRQQNFKESVSLITTALRQNPNSPEALYNLGAGYMGLDCFDAAVASYTRALVIKPDFVDALTKRGDALTKLRRHDQAIIDYEKALAIKPDHPAALGALAFAHLCVCNWDQTNRLSKELDAAVVAGKSDIAPLTFLLYSNDPERQLQCASNHVRRTIQMAPSLPCNRARKPHQPIRVAYVSPDFREHPGAHLMAGLFELHDRARFEIIGVSLGPDDGSEIRARVVRSFDQFYEVRFKSDHEIAKLLCDLQVDIAIDRNGHTNGARPAIFAFRPAPIQVAYLGYPGTTGAEFIDYMIADEVVLPLDQQRFYSEKIVYLPDSYLVNDSKRLISPHVPGRREVGLPETGFVFCCFNRSNKITAPIFNIWMQLLAVVEGSVLWLYHSNEAATANLRREAANRGIDPTRLVFAERIPVKDHLARHRLADLFLDTLPYNAHTTASDALWAGLPVLTCLGTTFVGRVAASLLNAAWLPELVTNNLEEYEALAVKLATKPSLMQSIRRKLEANRLTCPLFDTDRFRRHIEAAYMTMWELWLRGEEPRSFSVEPSQVAATNRCPGWHCHQ
jgi:protein O-GlcNAc transferase